MGIVKGGTGSLDSTSYDYWALGPLGQVLHIAQCRY